jgi:hypothetical protein
MVGGYNSCDENIPLNLVFFSPFEELRLRTAGIMEQKGIHRVYEPSTVPTLYVGRVEDLLGRVPLIPCFLDGNATSTIPHKYAADRKTLLSAAVIGGQTHALYLHTMHTMHTFQNLQYHPKTNFRLV